MILIFLILAAFVTVIHSQDVCECARPLIDDIWRLVPVGEGQLTRAKNELVKKTGTTEFHYPTKSELFEVLYHSSESPYKKVPPSPTSTAGVYNSFAQINRDLLINFAVKQLNGAPRFMMEVGSFFGSGAINTWAPLVRLSNHTEAIVLCVDTWQGDINMRLMNDFQGFMSLSNGHPSLYRKFLQRVVEFHAEDTIFPFPIASLVGARLLALTKWTVDMIYLDSAHETGETFAEMVLYFKLLRPGGLMMGDDYDEFPAVKHDVDLFVKYFTDKLTFHKVCHNEWAIVKL